MKLRWCGFVLLACLPGCASTCAPDVTIEARGQKIALGEYAGLKVGRAGPAEDIDPFVLALRDPDQDGGTLSVIPFGGGEPCELGRARTYSIPGVPHPDGTTVTNPETRLPFIDEPDGVLRFCDLDCQLHPPELPDAGTYQPIVDHASQLVTGFLARDSANRLYFLDPDNDVSRLIAEDVYTWMLHDNQLWLLEQTQLVVRELDGTEVARAGTNVTRFLPSWSRGEVVLADGPDLYLLTDLAQPPELLEAGACEPQYLSTTPPLLAFLSPCATRRLVVLDLDSKERSEYVENVGSFRQLNNWLFYVTGPPGTSSVGELWTVPPGFSPYKVGDNGFLWSIGFLSPDRYLVMLDVVDNRGRLGTWWVDQEFFEVATDVTKFTTMYDRVTVLTGSNGITGTLSVLDPDDFTEDLRVEGAAVNGWRFSYYAPALGYLDQYDEESQTGTLNVWVAPTGDHDEVDIDVAEFLELYWPDWGVLYTIHGGDGAEAGIYFAEVKVE
jgi:hypothetical protein